MGKASNEKGKKSEWSQAPVVLQTKRVATVEAPSTPTRPRPPSVTAVLSPALVLELVLELEPVS